MLQLDLSGKLFNSVEDVFYKPFPNYHIIVSDRRWFIKLFLTLDQVVTRLILPYLLDHNSLFKRIKIIIQFGRFSDILSNPVDRFKGLYQRHLKDLTLFAIRWYHRTVCKVENVTAQAQYGIECLYLFEHLRILSLIMVLIDLDYNVLEKRQHIIDSILFAQTFRSEFLNQVKQLLPRLKLKVNQGLLLNEVKHLIENWIRFWPSHVIKTISYPF